MDKTNEYLLSVFLITYNHEQYIAQAIESIVNQQTNFRFQIVIGEDGSTDNTRAICEQYAARYPDIINLLPSDRNYGAMENAIRVFMACTGKYMAFCEGDDYWTVPDKLQKQVDFLEANPDYSMCFTAPKVQDEMGWNLPDEMYFPKLEKDTYTIEDFILADMNMVPTAGLVIRDLLPRPFPEFFRRGIAGDLFTQIYIADKGKAKFLNFISSVYRNHGGGQTKNPAQIEKGQRLLKQFYIDMNEYLGYRYDKVFRQRLLDMSKVALIYGAKEKKGMERVRHYFRSIPDYIKYSERINFKELVYYHMVLFFPSLLKKMKAQ